MENDINFFIKKKIYFKNLIEYIFKFYFKYHVFRDEEEI